MDSKEWNYQESNRAKLPMPSNQSALRHARTFYQDYRELNEIKEEHLQQIADAVFMMFGVETVPVKFAGKQPVKQVKNGYVKRLGVHRTKGTSTSIQVYKLTGKRGQVRKPKSAIDTLLHEIMHELDIVILNLINSIHSKGFYMRIGQLKDMLG
jgi:hypothetical protein